MAEAKRRLLTGEACRPGGWQVRHQGFIFLGLVAAAQRVLKLIGHVEVIFDGPLAAPGDENEMLYSGFSRFVHDMLHDRAVDDGQHLLRHGLGGGQKARAEAGDGENSLANAFAHGEAR